MKRIRFIIAVIIILAANVLAGNAQTYEIISENEATCKAIIGKGMGFIKDQTNDQKRTIYNWSRIITIPEKVQINNKGNYSAVGHDKSSSPE